MKDDAMQTIIYVGIIYIIAMGVLIPTIIYLFTHRENPMDTRWWWPLGAIILLTILAFAAEFGALSML